MQFQYFNPKILLVINPHGQIRTLHTPFRVQHIANESFVYVDEIITNSDKELLYLVNGKIAPHSSFRIIINF